MLTETSRLQEVGIYFCLLSEELWHGREIGAGYVEGALSVLCLLLSEDLSSVQDRYYQGTNDFADDYPQSKVAISNGALLSERSRVAMI
ncbi:hypothetical protein A7U60_g7806 [Sanghuangporus baumii]|uniref:Uncharacterized protein n=1 Tax=Sanghuangporus baumii TaxID=108892 RepID=A0A9Q5HSH7_SANBA|nr:hypothetical protein A7U60_g7806 [Sanghuangporus baumii]